MAMTIANAGGKTELSNSKKRKIDHDDSAVEAQAIEDRAIEVPVTEGPAIEDDGETDEDFGLCLTQGKNSNITDQHGLFFMREQQLAIERQRMFLSKKKWNDYPRM